MAAAASVQLPKQFLQLAETEGLKRSALLAYIALQNSFFAGFLSRISPWFRDRLIYDRRFLFKVGAQHSDWSQPDNASSKGQHNHLRHHRP